MINRRLLRQTTGKRQNQPSAFTVFDAINDKHRENLSYPSSAECSSIQNSTEDSNKSDNFALFRSLENNSDFLSNLESKNLPLSTKNKQHNYNKKASYKKTSDVKVSKLRPRFSNSTLEYVVEGVQELDISESPKVIYINSSYLIILYNSTSAMNNYFINSQNF